MDVSCHLRDMTLLLTRLKKKKSEDVFPSSRLFPEQCRGNFLCILYGGEGSEALAYSLHLLSDPQCQIRHVLSSLFGEFSVSIEESLRDYLGFIKAEGNVYKDVKQ